MRKSIPLWLFLLTACASGGANSGSDSAVVTRARAIHQRVITIDTHDDIPLTFATPEYNPCTTLSRQVDLPKMRAGGLDVAFFTVRSIAWPNSCAPTRSRLPTHPTK